MILIINTYMVIEKEMELERQGLRRTRRWIGDASQVTDDRWYRRKLSLISQNGLNSREFDQDLEIKPQMRAHPSILYRLLQLLRNRRQSAIRVSDHKRTA